MFLFFNKIILFVKNHVKSTEMNFITGLHLFFSQTVCSYTNTVEDNLIPLLY